MRIEALDEDCRIFPVEGFTFSGGKMIDIVCTTCGSKRCYLQPNMLNKDYGWITCMGCGEGGGYRVKRNRLYIDPAAFLCTESTESTGPTTNPKFYKHDL